MLYKTKTTIAGQWAETREYPYVRARGNSLVAKRGTLEVVKKRSNKRRKDNVQRAKNRIKYLIHANTGTIRPIFVTLTYKDNITFRPRAQEDVGRFFRKLRTKYPGLQYIYIFEKQRRGAYHAHMVIFNHTFIPFQDIEDCWTMGYTNVKRLESATHISHYLGKYLTKTDNTDLTSCRSYSRSKNLAEPLEVYGEKALLRADEWSIDVRREYSTIHGIFSITTYNYDG